eukprot:GEMP01018945.1.p1 GENE.GEMP01018945.1~~GEMP01018945.1.p1  ORF type:complete len:659 (+),score=73.28 GEMP01018945.1:95-2071(+)
MKDRFERCSIRALLTHTRGKKNHVSVNKKYKKIHKKLRAFFVKREMSIVSMESRSQRESQRTQIQPVVEDDLKICGVICSKERVAWYCCDMASSIFGTYAMLFLIPLLLGRLARLRAYDGSGIPDSCMVLAEHKGPSWTVTCKEAHFSDNVTCALQGPQSQDHEDIRTRCTMCVVGIGKKLWHHNNAGSWKLLDENRVVPFFGMEIDFVSYASWIICISVASQSIALMSFGSFADYGAHRKRMLIICTVLGSLCNFLFVAAWGKHVYIIVGVLTILCNTFLGLSLLAYNSYLPILVDAHEKLCNQDAGCLDENSELHKFRLAHICEMSLTGNLFGYVGNLFAVATTFSILLVSEWLVSKQERQARYYVHVRASFVLIGVWWLLWSLPALLWLKPRAAAPLPVDNSNPWSFVTFGWRETWRSLCRAKKHRNTWRMLAANFICSDMYGTGNLLCIMIAHDKMCFSPAHLAILAMLMFSMTTVSGFATRYITRTWHVRPKSILVGCLIAYSCSSLYAVSGAGNSAVGFRAQWEVYVYVAVYGFLFCPISTYSRVLFADCIPLHRESSFFSMYVITDAGSSWLGPFVIGLIANSGADLRYGFLYLLVGSIFAAFLFHYLVDHNKGMVEAGRLRRHSESDDEKWAAERSSENLRNRGGMPIDS